MEQTDTRKLKTLDNSKFVVFRFDAIDRHSIRYLCFLDQDEQDPTPHLFPRDSHLLLTLRRQMKNAWMYPSCSVYIVAMDNRSAFDIFGKEQ